MTILSLYRTVLTMALKHCDRVCISISYEDIFNTKLTIETWKHYREVGFHYNAMANYLPTSCRILSLGPDEVIVNIQDEFGYECNRGHNEAQEAVFTLAKEILSIYRTEGRDINIKTNMCPDLIGIEVIK